MFKALAKLILILGIIGAVWVAYSSRNANSPDAQPVQASTPEYISGCTDEIYGRARKMVEDAISQGLLVPDVQSMSILVNEQFWSRMDFSTKRGMAKAVDCAVAGPGKTIVSFDYRGMQSGKTIAKWKLGKLIIN